MPGVEHLELGTYPESLYLPGHRSDRAGLGLGSTSSNYQQTFVGKKAFAVSALAALLIGGAAAIINFFYGAGQTI